MNAVETKEKKLAVISSYMKIILRHSLRLEADEPSSGTDADLLEIGVDSLMMIELKKAFRVYLEAN